jgi:hypothetical protein
MNKKSIFVVVTLLVIFFSACKEKTGYTIENLPKPQISGGKPLMFALRDRKTTREIGTKELTFQQISNLLWAADGINRPQSVGRTAPTAKNLQEIDIYAVLKSGVYLFDFKNNNL